MTGVARSRGILEGDTARHCTLGLLREAPIAARHRQRRGRAGRRSQKRSFSLARAGCRRRTGASSRGSSQLPGEGGTAAGGVPPCGLCSRPRRSACAVSVLGVRAKVMRRGHTLADGFADFRAYLALKSIAPRSPPASRPDTWTRCWRRLADSTPRRREEMRQKVMGARLYPIALTAMCVMIVAGLYGVIVEAEGGERIHLEPRAAAADDAGADRGQ